ncbi:MAG: WS/DGAT domain-containing protein [Acidobacteriota bacterium]
MSSQPPLERMQPQDSMWLQDRPENLMVVNAVYSLERIDLETLSRLWNERVIGAGGGERYPRFTKRVVVRDGRAYWQQDPDFDLARHITEIPPEAGIDSREKLQDFVGKMAAEPLPRDRPLWQMQLIPEFSPGVSAVAYRIHHCMGDGISMMPIIFSMIDQDHPEIESFANPPVQQVGAGRGGKSKLQVNLLASLAGPGVMLGKALALRDRSAFHGPPCSGEKRVAWTDPIPLDTVKAIKNALGATVNDVLMACVLGAFQRVAETSGLPLKRLRVSMPVNVRWPDEPLLMENRFATVLLKLPAKIHGVRARVMATKRRMDRLKRSPEPLVMFGAQNLLLHLLPSTIGRHLVDFFGNKTTCVLTNVPGPSVPLAIGGRRVHALVFWVPQRDRIGIGISILSFNGEVRIGVIGDTAVLPDPGALVDAFTAEVEALRQTVEAGESVEDEESPRSSLDP